MLGFTLGYDTGQAAPRRQEETAIVAWGDSLTAAGYPALAGALFDPPRGIVNKGIGGQGSLAIAARQGGRAITVTVTGDIIPARQDLVWSWDFDDGIQGWVNMGASSLAIVDGMLESTVSATAQGVRRALDYVIPNGQMMTVEFDLVMDPGLTVRVTGLASGVFAANNGGAVDGVQYTTGGHKVATLYAGRLSGTPATMSELSFCSIGATAGVFSVDNVVLTVPADAADYAVTVTDRSPNILGSLSGFSGISLGMLAGVHGIMSTDSSGNWTFTRDEEGPSALCPPGSIFVLDDAAAYKHHTAWIWAGNNGVANTAGAEVAKSDIAAMIEHLGHSRYLVASVLTSSAFAPERIAVLQQLNADLAALHGSRFVDVYAVLRASGDGSPEDNADIAAGYIPRSLRTDAIHLNAAGYAIVAQEMVAAMRRKGW